MKIALGYDHAAFAIKDEIIAFIEAISPTTTVTNFGPKTPEAVDYSDVAQIVANAVASKEFDRGILICGTGIGMSIAANKVDGIRCALCSEALSARLTREHNNTNVLALGERIIGIETMKDIIKTWIQTEFSNAQRHQNRIDKITKIEQLNK